MTLSPQRRSDLLDTLRTALIDDLRVRVEPDQIQPDTPLFGTGLGLDSVDAVDLIVGLESRLGVRIPDDREGRASLRTVNKLIGMLAKLQDARVDA